MQKYIFYFCLPAMLLFFSACASTSVDESPVRPQPAQPLPTYTGPKTIVAILPLGLSERAAQRYPHLLEKSVGLGVHNMVLESLFDTRRFTFVEQNPEIIKDLMDRQWMSGAGFVSNAQAVEYGKMLGAEKVIYGEIYDYSEGGEQVSGFSARQGFRITVGVQIVCTDITTGEKISLGTSKAAAATYGDAAKMAIDTAVRDLVRRLQ